MHIPKVFHSIFAGFLSGFASIVAFLLLRGRIGFLAILVAILCFPIVWVVGNIIADVADDWLRRVTKDQR